MSFRVSSDGQIYNALRKGFAVGGLLAWITVLMCLFRTDWQWLQRSGLLAAIIFSTGNVVLVYWPQRPLSRLEDDDQRGAGQ